MGRSRIFLVLFFVLFLFGVYGVNVDFYYGAGCPHCHNMLGFFNENISKVFANDIKSGKLNIHYYEVYSNETNRERFFKEAERFGTKVEGVPTIFIGGKVFVGDGDDTKVAIYRLLEKELNHNGSVNESSLYSNHKGAHSSKGDSLNRLTIPAVVSAALVDSINPCAFAVLIILLSTILATRDKKRALYAGIAFTIAIFISYYLMGVGLYEALNFFNPDNIAFVVGVFAIVLGLLNLKDFFWYGKGFVVEVPRSWRPKLQAIIKGVTSVYGAFFVGFIVSLFLLPCTSGPYVVILGMLSKVATRNYALLLLILYNLIFIIPMILITLLVYFGLTKVSDLEKMRKKNIRYLHLVAGLILLGLGLAVLLFGV